MDESLKLIPVFVDPPRLFYGRGTPSDPAAGGGGVVRYNSLEECRARAVQVEETKP